MIFLSEHPVNKNYMTKIYYYNIGTHIFGYVYIEHSPLPLPP